MKAANIIRSIFIFIFSCVGFFSHEPAWAVERLEVDGVLNISSNISGPPRAGLVLTPQDSTPVSPVDSQLYYNSTARQPFYFEAATGWKNMGSESGNLNEGSIIVAAQNSLATRCNGTSCVNSRADIGFTCNGTNDQIFIQKAIAQLKNDTADEIGGAVYLLEGTYNITAPINLNNTGLGDSAKAIIGTGKGTVLRICGAGNNINVINASNVERLLISQLMIAGDNKAGSFRTGIYFNGVNNSKIDKVWLENLTTFGIYLHSSDSNIVFGNNIANGSAVYGISLDSCNRTLISNNNMRSMTTGVGLIANNNCTIISNNNIENMTGDGINIAGSQGVSVSNNNIQNNNGVGIFAYSGSNTFVGNNVQGNTRGIVLQGSCNSTVSSNYVQANAQDGITLMGGARNNIVRDNIIYDNGATGAYSGIKLDTGASFNQIAYNRIFDSAGTGSGINVNDSTCNNSYIISNLIDGVGYIDSSASSPYDNRIRDVGTGNNTKTKYTDKLKLSLERVEVSCLSSGLTLNVTGNPKSYLALVPPATAGSAIVLGNPAVANGKTAGDILVLEGEAGGRCIRINNAATLHLNSTVTYRDLYADDVLTLLWDGGNWVEIGWADN